MKDVCCQKFNPKSWDKKTIVWKNKKFVRDKVAGFLHIPLNFGTVMRRNIAKIEAANAELKSMIVLSDENSLWGSDVYLEASKTVPRAKNTSLSGTFLSLVFEGPYQKMGGWIAKTRAFVQSKGKKVKKLLFYYTTCPKCAKRYGKNYVVILAQV